MKKNERVTAIAVANGVSHFNHDNGIVLVGRSLPTVGMSRWRDIEPLVSMSRESFRQLVKAGKAPKGIRLSERSTYYSNEELHKFFNDPLNYSAPLKE